MTPTLGQMRDAALHTADMARKSGVGSLPEHEELAVFDRNGEVDREDLIRAKHQAWLYELLEEGLKAGRLFDFHQLFSDDDMINVPYHNCMKKIQELRTLRHPFAAPFVLTFVVAGNRVLLLIIPKDTDAPLQDFICASFGFGSEQQRQIGIISVSVIQPVIEPEGARFSIAIYNIEESKLREYDPKMAAAMPKFNATAAAICVLALTNPHTVRREVIPTKEQLRARRILKRPLPYPYTDVANADYHTVLALSPVAPASLPGGSTHASPIMHERRGHWCTRKASGKRYWVRAHIVKPDNPGPQRTHYDVRPTP